LAVRSFFRRADVARFEKREGLMRGLPEACFRLLRCGVKMLLEIPTVEKVAV
jgi:hypothetical protein